jgi:hypothetical protein
MKVVFAIDITGAFFIGECNYIPGKALFYRTKVTYEWKVRKDVSIGFNCLKTLQSMLCEDPEDRNKIKE